MNAVTDQGRGLNPFGDTSVVQLPTTTHAEGERAIQEVQAAMVIAKRFPRDPIRAMDRILQACTRPTLAESALYAYPRGGETITGPSIRLAEALAQSWGNIQFGIRELDQRGGESTVEAFAWDVETNTRQTKTFQVRHIRYTRKGIKTLEDPRDIYEMTANQGARRLRACILGLIPGDVVDAAEKQCEITMKNRIGAPEEEIKKLVDAFGAMGVTADQLARRLGHRLDTVIAAEIIQLRKIYRSIRDNFASADDFFESAPAADAANEVAQKLNQTLMGEQNGEAEKSMGEPQGWPRKNADGYWYDESGAIYDEEKYGWDRGKNQPSMKGNLFRAKRGTAKQASPPQPAPDKDSGATDVARQHTVAPHNDRAKAAAGDIGSQEILEMIRKAETLERLDEIDDLIRELPPGTERTMCDNSSASKRRVIEAGQA